MPQQRKHRDLWFPHAAKVSPVLEPGGGGIFPEGCTVSISWTEH